MAGFYKVLLRGAAVGQEINNILYYAPLIPVNEEFNESDAEGLGEAVGAAWLAQIVPLLSGIYNFEGTDVSMVDETGAILSPFVVSVPGTGSGVSGNNVDGPGNVLIAKFNCTPVAEAAGHPVPRRSYLALGPLVTESIGTSGLIVGQENWQTACAAAFTQGHLVNAVSFVPYRIGRQGPPTAEEPAGRPAGVGRVHSIVARPYASYRRSRLFSPTGN